MERNLKHFISYFFFRYFFTSFKIHPMVYLLYLNLMPSLYKQEINKNGSESSFVLYFDSRISTFVGYLQCCHWKVTQRLQAQCKFRNFAERLSNANKLQWLDCLKPLEILVYSFQSGLALSREFLCNHFLTNIYKLIKEKNTQPRDLKG